MNRKEMLEEIKRLQAENKRLEQRCDLQNAMLNQLHIDIAKAPSARLAQELQRQVDLANEAFSMLRFLERVDGFITLHHVPESESDDGYDANYWVLEEPHLQSYTFGGLVKKWKEWADAQSK